MLAQKVVMRVPSRLDLPQPSAERDKREIAKLRDELDELQERFAAYKRAMEPPWVPPIQLGLTRSEGKVLATIYRRQYASTDQIMSVLYDGRSEPPSERSVETLVRLVRRKVNPFRIEVQNRWGIGFYISTDDKARLAALENAPKPPAGETMSMNGDHVLEAALGLRRIGRKVWKPE